jgi:hypothetical protein
MIILMVSTGLYEIGQSKLQFSTDILQSILVDSWQLALILKWQVTKNIIPKLRLILSVYTVPDSFP